MAELDPHIHFSPMKSPDGVDPEGVQEPGGKPASSPPSPAESPYQGAGSAAVSSTDEYETDANVLEMPSLTLLLKMERTVHNHPPLVRLRFGNQANLTSADSGKV